MLGIDDVEAGKRTGRLDHPGSCGTGERVAFKGDLPGDGVVLGPPNPSPRALPDTGDAPQRASSSASQALTRPSPWYHAPFLVRSFLKRLPIFIPKVVPLSKWRMLLVFPQLV